MARRSALVNGPGVRDVFHRAAIIRAIRRHRRHVGIDLIKPMRDFSDAADNIRCQLDRDRFMGCGTDAEMKPAPSPPRPNAVL
jgi:hypothetical protein